MPPMHFFNPLSFVFESVYTLIVVFFLFLVYFKTKEMYDLTKHQGIKYFRLTFLFFGLAYLARFVFHFFQLSLIALDIFLHWNMGMPIMMTLTGYLSTMAIFFLTYSMMWKKIRFNYFLLFSNIAAIVISLAAFISRSPIIVSLVQIPLIVITLVVSHRREKNEKSKKKSIINLLYFLIALFWLMNLFVLGPTRLIPFEAKAFLQLLSISVFVYLYYKVSKWAK